MNSAGSEADGLYSCSSCTAKSQRGRVKAFDAQLVSANPTQGQLSSVAQWCETNKWLRQASKSFHTRCALEYLRVYGIYIE